MADTPDLLKWRCQYAYSGSCPNSNAVSGSNNISCEIPATPICGDTEFTCDAGSPYDQQAGTWSAVAGRWSIPPTWICDLDGQYSGIPGINCTIPVNAVCGQSDNLLGGCMIGTYQDEPGGDWTCLAFGGGTDASCPSICGRSPFIGVNPHDNPYFSCAFFEIFQEWKRCMGIPTLTVDIHNCYSLDNPCGPDYPADDNPTDGCTAGQYNHVPGPSWSCVNAVDFFWGGFRIRNAVCPMPGPGLIPSP